jgi:predicted DsbA family dithiol-disulfide isomerase
MTIPVAHDFTCPWCWVGFHQAIRLREEFGVSFDWLGYELYPDEMPWPEPSPKKEEPPDKPKIPTRMELMYAADDMEPPTALLPRQMRVRNALLAVEYAKDHGSADQIVAALYRAYWEAGQNISDLEFLERLGNARGINGSEMRKSIEERLHLDRLTPFDDGAYAKGVYNVPTFFIDGQRYAEQPYRVIRKAVALATQEVA